MKRTMRFYCLVIVLEMVCFGVSSRLLAHDHNNDDLSGTDKSPEAQHLNLNLNTDHDASKMKQEEMYKGMNKKLGSSPPSCMQKCYGCMPCEPTQVPTDTSRVDTSRVELQYTNYMPEGWKCKCGPSFYSP